jgi:hypothetical protein
MIGTALGILFYDFKNQQYMNHPYKINQGVLDISNFNVNDVLEDTHGRLWVATREGLTMIDPFNNYIKKFGQSDGLKNDIINCIEEDRAHNIWISKSSGLSQISIMQDQLNSTYQFRVHNFSETDGLQAKEFNVNASIKLRNGQLIFGGPNGFNIFDPKEIDYNSEPPQIYFTDFQVFNESVAVGEKIGEKEILDQSILSTRSIELKHAMNVFTIEFSVLNYLLSKQVICQYSWKALTRIG